MAPGGPISPDVNLFQVKTAHNKQLGPSALSLDRGRGRGRGHRAALAVWFTTLIGGQGWTIDFSNKQQQQAGGPKLDISGMTIA